VSSTAQVNGRQSLIVGALGPDFDDALVPRGWRVKALGIREAHRFGRDRSGRA
jgi:hypothetical protein